MELRPRAVDSTPESGPERAGTVIGVRRHGRCEPLVAARAIGLLEGSRDCEKITLVCDHLNTHTKGAFYKVFEPTRARQLVRRIEFCYTPKHGSWLNIAENELSSLTRQCVRGRRIGDLGTLHGEVSAWSTDVNGRNAVSTGK